jgi:hypothetical protein
MRQRQSPKLRSRHVVHCSGSARFLLEGWSHAIIVRPRFRPAFCKFCQTVALLVYNRDDSVLAMLGVSLPLHWFETTLWMHHVTRKHPTCACG